jgi:hypothetical protein
MDKLPKQGSRKPWRIYQNYVLDIMSFQFAALDDGVLEFSGPSAAPSSPQMSHDGPSRRGAMAP